MLTIRKTGQKTLCPKCNRKGILGNGSTIADGKGEIFLARSCQYCKAIGRRKWLGIGCGFSLREDWK